MRKKILSVCLIVLMILSLSTIFMACDKNEAPFETNLLKNSSFETVSDSSAITDWQAKDTSKVSFPSNTRGDDDYKPELGTRYLKISETSGAYTYLAQEVVLEKNANYRIKAYVNVSSVVETTGIGFRISFESDTSFIGLNVVDHTEGFEEKEYYFTSAIEGPVKFIIAIGSNKINTTATALVDNVSLEKVESIPQSYVDEYKIIEVLKDSEKSTFIDAGSIVFVILMTLLSVALAIVAIILIKIKTNKPVEVELKEQEKPNKKSLKEIFTSNFALFIYVILGAFAIRFVITVFSFGMTTQIKGLQDLANLIVKNGLLSIYSTNESLTMPMGTTILYSLLGAIANAMKIKAGSLGFAILMRLPMIISEVVSVYLIYSFTSKHKDETNAAIFAGIYAFMPLFFFYSAFGGFVDVIAITFLIAVMISILNKDYLLTSILYTIAIMFSHYALILLPIILIFEVYAIMYDEQNRWLIAITMVVSFTVFFLVNMVLSFSAFKEGNVFVYFERILAFFKSNSFLTNDSFNIYAIFGANASKTRSTLVEVLNWLFVAGYSIIPAYIYFKNKNRANLVLFSAVAFIVYAAFGAGSNIEIMPIGIALLLLYIVIMPENRLYAIFASLASLSFLNIAQIAAQSGFITAIEGAAYKGFEPATAFMIIFSILTVLVSGYLVYVSMEISYSNTGSMITDFDKSPKESIKEIFAKKKKK